MAIQETIEGYVKSVKEWIDATPAKANDLSSDAKKLFAEYSKYLSNPPQGAPLKSFKEWTGSLGDGIKDYGNGAVEAGKKAVGDALDFYNKSDTAKPVREVADKIIEGGHVIIKQVTEGGRALYDAVVPKGFMDTVGEFFSDLWKNHKGKVIGGGLGLIGAMLFGNVLGGLFGGEGGMGIMGLLLPLLLIGGGIAAGHFMNDSQPTPPPADARVKPSPVVNPKIEKGAPAKEVKFLLDKNGQVLVNDKDDLDVSPKAQEAADRMVTGIHIDDGSKFKITGMAVKDKDGKFVSQDVSAHNIIIPSDKADGSIKLNDSVNVKPGLDKAAEQAIRQQTLNKFISDPKKEPVIDLIKNGKEITVIYAGPNPDKKNEPATRTIGTRIEGNDLAVTSLRVKIKNDVHSGPMEDKVIFENVVTNGEVDINKLKANEVFKKAIHDLNKTDLKLPADASVVLSQPTPPGNRALMEKGAGLSPIV